MTGVNSVSFLSVQLETVTFLELKPLTAEQLPAVVELDKVCFGGLWTLEGYRRELVSPSSDLLVLNLTRADFKLGGNGNRVLETGNREQENPQNPLFPEATPSYPIPDNQSPIPDTQYLVGLGCSWGILDEAHITVLAVHPVYRREGLGLLLLSALLRLAQRRGLERATLEVRASNHAALSLYQKFGFKEAGRRRRYYKDTGEDALILWRGGLQKPEFAKTLEECHKSVCDRILTKGWQLLEIGLGQSWAQKDEL